MLALPPPPPMDWARMPSAPAPRVMISPELVTVTAPPLPPSPPEPPMEISGVLVVALMVRLAAMDMPPLPPPPPTDWATIPWAKAPLVSIRPPLVTVTVPAVLPVPPEPPMAMPAVALSLPVW